MIRDTARVERVSRTLGEAGLEALIAMLPAHVLMLTGSWPVVGIALAITHRDGRVAILAPEDERELAEGGWADELHTFQPVSPSERAEDAGRGRARATDGDRAARGILEGCGLGQHFKHPAGHGVGSQAIDHNARPRLHPESDDVLEPGMVFNLEPAVYFDGECGLRHCDMVAVTADGHEVLTPFQATIDQLIVH